MGIGDRIREERSRLGLSQADFAALAGASKGAQLKWEKESSFPAANILVAWGNAGADTLYILTGRRRGDYPAAANTSIADQLADIRRDLLEPVRRPLPGEDESLADRRILERHAAALRAMLKYDREALSPAELGEVYELLEVVTDPERLNAVRVADHALMRLRRREMRERIASHFNPERYEPGEPVIAAAASIALEYNVPFRFLVDLIEDVFDDLEARSATSAASAAGSP